MHAFVWPFVRTHTVQRVDVVCTAKYWTEAGQYVCSSPCRYPQNTPFLRAGAITVQSQFSLEKSSTWHSTKFITQFQTKNLGKDIASDTNILEFSTSLIHAYNPKKTTRPVLMRLVVQKCSINLHLMPRFIHAACSKENRATLKLITSTQVISEQMLFFFVLVLLLYTDV